MALFSPDVSTPSQQRPASIELGLRDVRQLFNSMDPSPFIEKDLDRDAEEFIVSSAEEFPPNTALTLRVHLAEWPAEEPTALIRSAVHNYFSHRAKLKRQEFRFLMKRGRASLVIGLLFLATCLLMSELIAGSRSGTWAGVVRESLTIAGWVAMWRPMEIYLYDWWPLRRRGRIYSRLSLMPVEVIHR